MKMKTRLIPFDINKVKNGAKVVTRDGKPARIGLFDVKNKNFPILGVVEEKNGNEFPWLFREDGGYFQDKDLESPYDLFIEEEVHERLMTYDKAHERLMTYDEVAMWLTEKPHRQYRKKDSEWCHTRLSYVEEDGNKEADEFLIRENLGEWRRPLIQID